MVFIGNILGIYLIGFLGLGIKLSSFDDILLLVLFIGLLNAILWPILTRIAMPFLVLTFGFGALILNGFFPWGIRTIVWNRNPRPCNNSCSIRDGCSYNHTVFLDNNWWWQFILPICFEWCQKENESWSQGLSWSDNRWNRWACLWSAIKKWRMTFNFK